jgi:hypothetical protein
VVSGSLTLGSAAVGLIVVPSQATGGILLSRIRSVNIDRPPTVSRFTRFLHPARVLTRVDRPARRNLLMDTMGRTNGALFTIAALMVLLFCMPSGNAAASGRTYRVHGQVIAVNITQTPHMIVVKTPLTAHDDMTVGAKVTSQTKIIRKGKRIALQAIRIGERVWLTYIKQRDGVFAQIIQTQ